MTHNSTRSLNRRRRPLFGGLLLLCALLAGGAAPSPAQPVVERTRVDAPGLEERLRETVEALAALPTRAPGYGGADRATAIIRQAFIDAGLQQVRVQPFEVAVPVENRASLEVGGETFQIHSFWPNHSATSRIEEPTGLAGRLLDGGNGDLEQLDGEPVEGAVVLYDMDCGMNWMRAMSLGARAILFVEPEDAIRPILEDKWLSVPVPLPRFWVPRDTARHLRRVLAESPGAAVRLRCDMDWTNAATANVWGLLEGRGVAPAMKKDANKADPVLVLVAHYDANSAVPALAPGAEAACSVAGLIELARVLAANPPGQRVVFIATGAHYQTLAGAGMAVRAYDLANRNVKLPKEIDPDGALSQALIDFATPYFGFRAADKEKPEVKCVSFDLSSHGNKIVLGNRGNFDIRSDIYRDRKYGELGRRVARIAREVCESMDLVYDDLFVDTTNAVHGRIESFFNEDAIFESEIFAMAVPSLFFTVGNDSRPHLATPHDTPEKVDFERLARVVHLLTNVVPRMTDAPIIWRDVEVDYSVRGVLFGECLMSNFLKSVVPIDPVPGTIVTVRQMFGWKGMQYRTHVRPVYGIQMNANAICDAAGLWSIPWSMWPEMYRLDAFTYDDRGRITHAADQGQQGNRRYSFAEFHMAGQGGKKLTVVPFPCHATIFPDLVDPRYLLSFKFLQLINARIGTEPFEFGYSLPAATRYDTSRVEPVLMTYTQDDVNLQIIMSLGLIGRNLVFINATDEEPRGIGIPTLQQQVITHLPLRVAEDMWKLDHYRQGQWERFGIINDRLNKAHTEAGISIELARDALAERRWSDLSRHAQDAWASETRVYPDLAATGNDVVRGVIFYLMLCIPFAYCMERLLFCYGDIRKQIAGAAAIFLVIVIVLGFVHPAFKITLTPYIIFLAFVITTLAGVIGLVLIGRFREEFRLMRGGVLATYATDASPVGAALQGVNLGIGMMRRRSTRTILTVITLVILTFAILSFTSVKPFVRFNQHLLPYAASYEGILYRNFDWSPLETPEVVALERALADRFVTAPRSWLMSTRQEEQLAIQVRLLSGDGLLPAEDPGVRTTAAQGARLGTLAAIVGLGPNEARITGVDRCLAAGRWLPEGRKDVCLIPSALADVLGIREHFQGRRLSVFGRPLEIVGLLDEEKWQQLRDLTDGPLSPVNTVEMRAVPRDRLAQTDPSDAAEQQFRYLSASQIIVTHSDWLVAQGGTYRSVAAAPRLDAAPLNIRGFVEDLMQRWSIAVYAGIDGRAYVFSSIGASSLQGAGGLLIPVIIGSLIILNALLGSVFEREREIWTYSSLGVPQKMIGMLFVAEGAVYGILGSVLGYLVGQGVAKLVTATQLVEGLTLNYSSTSAFTSMVLVILVTLVSAIYPARKAYLSANPGFIGLMDTVEPVDDTWLYNLPFVVHRDVALAQTNFLMDYFDSHKEEAVGGFTTGEIAYRIERDANGQDQYRMEFDCWLAPYDFGVSHHATIWTTQDLEHDMMRYQMTLRRLSGDMGSCRRANREFLLALRKRMLVWRILKDADRERFRQMHQPESGDAA